MGTNCGRTVSRANIVKRWLVLVSVGLASGCDYFNDGKDDIKRFEREIEDSVRNVNEQNKKLWERVRQLEAKNEEISRDVSEMGKAIEGVAKEVERFEMQEVSSYITKEEFDYADMQSMVIRITNHLWRVNRKERKAISGNGNGKEVRKRCHVCQGRGSTVEECNEPEFVRCTGCGGCGMIYQDTSKCRGTIHNCNGYITTFSRGWKSSANSRPCPMCVNKKNLNNSGTGMMKNPNYRKAKRKTCYHCDGTGYEP